MIIAQLSIVPLGKGTSVSKYVQIAISVLKQERITFQTNAMGTILEAEDLETVFCVVQKVHNAVLQAGAQRVITELKIDDRRDKNASIASKLASLTK